MGLRNGFSSIVAFLRAGYPDHAPAVGYAPLLALLPRRIGDDEVAVIASALIGHPPRTIDVAIDSAIDKAIDNADVGVAITRITDEMPSCEDIDRVQQRLDAIGRAGG
ncbi:MULTISPECIES: DUF3349 domain-containing protein [unclassified Mycobacterium]|uniref:DUF3349 domain-containing protein n=1 Tax=unclassified Mycobacterium TaxID=2642494 RepID=UPI0007FEBD9D|nr:MULTISPECIES: DUF3349 domain-containing protein [unclassified Mycobacterium]OBH00366.1 hypothetical protein A5696_16645 [Mycobacterium sp. E2699]OBI51195.1 hypothetical protein A5705_09275 [Mycobacterium sp. E787]